MGAKSDPSRVATIQQMRRAGATLAQIAAEVGLSVGSIRHHTREMLAYDVRVAKYASIPEAPIPSAPKKSGPPAIPKKAPAPEPAAYERSEYWPPGDPATWTPEQWDQGLREAYRLDGSAEVVHMDTGMERITVNERWMKMGLEVPKKK